MAGMMCRVAPNGSAARACREERRRERERERRLDARDAHGVKKSKLTRDRERDISEKIALGQANVRATGEAMYDQRLFNQVLLTTAPACPALSRLYRTCRVVASSRSLDCVIACVWCLQKVVLSARLFLLLGFFAPAWQFVAALQAHMCPYLDTHFFFRVTKSCILHRAWRMLGVVDASQEVP